jgi:hypothetical protein
MSDKKFKFWTGWLFWANVMTVGVGLLVAFAGNSFVFDMHNDATREVYFGGGAFPPGVLEMKNWLFGVIGGTIVGFHLLMIFIVKFAFANRERWAWWSMWAGLLGWFVVDSSVSAYWGAWHNVTLINLVALVFIGLPLIMTGGAFGKPKQQG